MTGQRFARRVFLGAGIYGLLILLPQFFLEARVNRDFPPPIAHPEYFYGFLGIALAWQLAFLVIARDVVRYRALMLPAMAEKAAFGGAVVALYLQGRVGLFVLGPALFDLLLGLLFAAAFLLTRPAVEPRGRGRGTASGDIQRVCGKGWP